MGSAFACNASAGGFGSIAAVAVTGLEGATGSGWAGSGFSRAAPGTQEVSNTATVLVTATV